MSRRPYLQALDVILLASGGGGVGLGAGEDWLELLEGDSLLAQRGRATGSDDGSVGHIAAQSAEDVAWGRRRRKEPTEI